MLTLIIKKIKTKKNINEKKFLFFARTASDMNRLEINVRECMRNASFYMDMFLIEKSSGDA